MIKKSQKNPISKPKSALMGKSGFYFKISSDKVIFLTTQKPSKVLKRYNLVLKGLIYTNYSFLEPLKAVELLEIRLCLKKV